MSEHNVKLNSSAGVRHGEITQDLAEGIFSGRFPVGSLLPTELELCTQYGASRHSMRVALAELVEMGLVSRRKRAGTLVEARTPPDRFRQSLTSLEDLVQFGTTHVRQVQETGKVVIDPALSRTLGCRSGTRWLRISSLRLNGTEAVPIGWTDVYVDPAYTDIPDLARVSPDTLVSTLIETHHGRQIAEIQQDVAAVPMPPRLAGVLQTEAASPALRIIRRYLDGDGQAFEISDTVHPTGRFTVSTKMKRERV